MFYTYLPAVNLLFSWNWPVGSKKLDELVARWNLVYCICINSVWTSPHTVLLINCKLPLLLSFPECVWSKCFHAFWKKYWTLVLPIPEMFLSLHVHMLQDKPHCSLCMYGVCFFYRTWHNYIFIIFHGVFWEFLFVGLNSCHLSCFV